MTADRPVRIANCSGFYGDRISAAREMVEGGPIDVLTGVDHRHGRPHPVVHLAVDRSRVGDRRLEDLALFERADQVTVPEHRDLADRVLLDQAERSVEQKGSAVEEGARFHLLLAEATQNEILRQFVEMAQLFAHLPPLSSGPRAAPVVK